MSEFFFVSMFLNQHGKNSSLPHRNDIQFCRFVPYPLKISVFVFSIQMPKVDVLIGILWIEAEWNGNLNVSR